MQKILIANRGEIALRVMKSAKELGIKTLAVYSEADRTALHVHYADEALCIGPAPSAQSYLLSEKILEVAKEFEVDAIHPGYGFLSENADFASKVEAAGMTFIGPSAHSMKEMGDKLSAKRIAKEQNVPVLPGSEGEVLDEAEMLKIVEQTGYPILIKASAGGGGKGMRIVWKDSELVENFNRAKSEALSAFGNGAVFIEKYIAAPRHIEIQVLADNHGNCVYLFERECSIQRRHQKLVEEAPSSILDEDLRKKMGTCAVNLALACKYSGAGTVEFLMDEARNFYFLEMNTRLQVEHPVTEFITGVDLVKEQIYVAMGKPLSFKQSDLRMNGHAIELRVNAEDPAHDFMPITGVLSTYQPPSGPGIRVDDAYQEGMEIPIFYDPMIGKLIVYASTRTLAIQKMKRAIQDFHISGIETTLPFGLFVMNHKLFVEGNYDTHFVEKCFKPSFLNQQGEILGAEKVAAAFLTWVLDKRKSANFNGGNFSNKGNSKGALIGTKSTNWRKRMKMS